MVLQILNVNDTVVRTRKVKPEKIKSPNVIRQPETILDI